MRIPDSEIIGAYEAAGSVHEAGKMLGCSHSTVHRRLQTLGIGRNNTRFSELEAERLRLEYPIYRDELRLDDLAEAMGRTKQFICRKARDMGLTDQCAKRIPASRWKYLSAEGAELIFEDFKKSSLGMKAYCNAKGYGSVFFSTTMRRFFGDEWDHVIELKVPKTSKYKLGRNLEYRVRDRLRELGYFAMRSPASKTPVDVVGIRKGVVLLVQCKLRGAVSVGEWNTLYDLAESVGAFPVVASTPTGRGTVFELMTGRKDGSKKRQPKRSFDPAVPE